MGGVARAPVERGDASDAFALELIVGIFYIGRHPFARRAGERRPIVRKDAEALEIAFRIAAANQDTELLVAAETAAGARSEEHTSELQSLMRISYAVFCLKKKINTTTETVSNIFILRLLQKNRSTSLTILRPTNNAHEPLHA